MTLSKQYFLFRRFRAWAREKYDKITHAEIDLAAPHAPHNYDIYACAAITNSAEFQSTSHRCFIRQCLNLKTIIQKDSFSRSQSIQMACLYKIYFAKKTMFYIACNSLDEHESGLVIGNAVGSRQREPTLFAHPRHSFCTRLPNVSVRGCQTQQTLSVVAHCLLSSKREYFSTSKISINIFESAIANHQVI